MLYRRSNEQILKDIEVKLKSLSSDELCDLLEDCGMKGITKGTKGKVIIVDRQDNLIKVLKLNIKIEQFKHGEENCYFQFNNNNSKWYVLADETEEVIGAYYFKIKQNSVERLIEYLNLQEITPKELQKALKLIYERKVDV